MAAKLLRGMQEHGHSITVGFGALGAAATAGYWVNQNEKKFAVSAADMRAATAENEKKFAVSAADMRAATAENEKKFAVSAADMRAATAENEKKFAVSAADARADKAEHREFVLQKLLELGNAAEYKSYMVALGEQKLNTKHARLQQEEQ